VPGGKLFIVATPIGNLDDVTYRAVRVLGEVDVIACEDTRHSRKLLDHYGIEKPLVSYHEHNELPRSGELVDHLLAGKNIALISDAGTPLISDPGYRIVSQAAAAGVTVVPIPGASAVLAALTASGLPTDTFYFGGFLPAKTTQRRRTLDTLRTFPSTLVFYEAPHRVRESLQDIAEVLGRRQVVLMRELTKLHEEILRGTASEIAQILGERDSIKGEITMVIGKAAGPEPDARPMAEAIDELIAAGMNTMDAIKSIARERGLNKRDVYAEYERLRS